jgi:hypothetical protein
LHNSFPLIRTIDATRREHRVTPWRFRITTKDPTQ